MKDFMNFIADNYQLAFPVLLLTAAIFLVLAALILVNLSKLAASVRKISGHTEKSVVGDMIPALSSALFSASESFRDASASLTSVALTTETNITSAGRLAGEVNLAFGSITGQVGNIMNDLKVISSEIKEAMTAVRELGIVMKNETDSRIHEASQYYEQFATLSGRLGSDVENLSKITAEAFSHSLADSSKAVMDGFTQSISILLKEINLVLDTFRDNEAMLAKAISLLPEQTMAYNESVVAKLGRQMDEIKELSRR